MAQTAANFPVDSYQITGDNPLDAGETRLVLAPYTRGDASMQTLEQARAALQDALRARGFGLHRVSLSAQEAGPVVTLRVLRFALGTIAVEGASRYDAANIRASVPALREGETPNLHALAVQTALANESPGKQIRVALRQGDATSDTIDAVISVRESARPWTIGIGASNFGTDATGRDRVTVFGSHANLFNLDHQLLAAFTTSAEAGAAVRQLGLAWRAPVYAAGGTLSASFTRSDVSGDFGAFSSSGAGRTWGLAYVQQLAPAGARRSRVSLALDDRLFEAALINGIVIPGQLDRRSRPVTLGYAAHADSAAQAWRYGAELAVNTGSGHGNDLASYRAEDPGIATARWKALRGSGSYTAPLSGGWQFAARGQWQLSPDRLIAGEQFGLGGLNSVRGTRQERPIAGDQGATGSVEMTTPSLAPGLRLFGFADAGRLSNRGVVSAARPGSDIIASVGVGLRWSQAPVAVGIDYGRVVNGSTVPLSLNSFSPQKGNDRVYLNLVARF